MSLDHDAAAALFGSGVSRPDPPRRRPLVVTLACALVVGWGALEFVAAAGGLLVSLTGGRIPSAEQLGFVGWMFHNFVALAAVQLICGALTILFGIGLWLGWSWARLASQAMMVFWAGAFVALGVAMASGPDTFSSSQPLVTTFFVFWRVTALVAGFLWAAMAALPAWLLKRPDARQWFQKCAG